MQANTMLCLDMSKCQFHMANSNVIPMRLHLHVQSQNLAIYQRTNKMKWPSIVLINQWEANIKLCLDMSKCQFHMGKLQCYSNGTSSPYRLSKLSN